MTKFEAYKYHKEELAKHGWHVVNMMHIDDVKDHLNGGTEIVEIPSDEVLNKACAYVAEKHIFEDYSYCINWAIETIHEWEKEEAV